MDRGKSDQNRVAQALGTHDVPLLLLETGRDPGVAARNLVYSVAVHILIGLALWSLPEVTRPPARAPEVIADLRRAVKLVAPRFTELTQKDPNTGKPTKSLDVRSAVSTPQPSQPRIPTVAPIPSPPPAPTPVNAPPEVVDPPRIEIAVNSGLPQGGAMPQLPPSPTPQTDKGSEKPKLAFESVGSASVRSTSTNPAVTMPRNSVQELTSRISRPGAGGIAVGDEIGPAPDIGLPGQVPAPGRMGSNLQLLSDTQGVDFKPYLLQVLSVVRRNWMTVVPESARLGRKGVVVVQFIIDRNGKIPKLVIASPSGTAAFDRAAVAGVSMSNPFPTLPVGYKGEEVRLQLAFAYNMSK